MKTDTTMSDDAVLAELGQALAARRLDMELTQAELSKQAGISKRTVERIEAGHSCQTTALIRVLRTLDLLEALGQLIPPAGPRPMDLLKRQGRARKRAYSKRRHAAGASMANDSDLQADEKKLGGEWTWGDTE